MNVKIKCASLSRYLGLPGFNPFSFNLQYPLNDSTALSKTQHFISQCNAFVDELRHALALGYIHDSRLSLVDIAYLLGFSEQSAFQRAFKRWTGMTPGEYRHSLR